MFLCFIDLTKAYDSANCQAMVAILREYETPHQLAENIDQLHSETWCHIRSAGDTSESSEVKSGVWQGCVLSTLLFNCVMDKIIREVMATLSGGLRIECTTNNGLFLTYRDRTPCMELRHGR